jgi:uncharacterized protein (DUF952 family)
MIYHITFRTAWSEAQAKGKYTAPSFAAEGFIHCSTREQLLPAARHHFKGQTGLIVLVIEPTLLSSTLKWEPPSGGTPPPGVAAGVMFPHIFGALNLDAVVNVVELGSNEDGTFSLPRDL